MDHDEVQPGEAGAPSYAAVANPEAPTHVHSEHRDGHHHQHKHHQYREQHSVDHGQEPSYAQVANPTVPTHVNDDHADDEDPQTAPTAATPGLPSFLAGDNSVYRRTSSSSRAYTESERADDGHEAEPDLHTDIPKKEPGESVQPSVHQDTPRQDSNRRADPSRSPRALHEVKDRDMHVQQPKKEHTALQKHCDFFDPDGDGVIWPWDTFFGFWVLGYAVLWCFIAVLVIHGSFSWPTQPHFPLPDPFFRIYIDRISMCKHGSDTGAFDHDGQFDTEPFERMFEKNAKTHPEALTGHELFQLIRRNRVLFDPFGWIAGALEWLAVYLLFWPQDGLFRKDDIRGIYDGSVFYVIAHEQKKKGRFTPPGWGKRVQQVKQD